MPKKRRKKDGRGPKRRKTLYPPGLYQKSAGEIAAYFARRSRGFPGALSKLRAYWDGMGFCNRTHIRYDRELCGKLQEVVAALLKEFSMQESELNENLIVVSDREQIPSGPEVQLYPYGYPGTLVYLMNIRKAWQSPKKISDFIYHTMEERNLIEFGLPLLKTYFNAAYYTVVNIMGFGDPRSPFYDPRLYLKIDEMKRQAWNFFLAKVRSMKKDLKAPEEGEYAEPE